MTTEERKPRRRRRHRKKSGAGPGLSPESPGAGQPPTANASSGAQGARRRSRRRRRKGPAAGTLEAAASIPLIGGEDPGVVSGILHVRSNGSGILVSAANNYVPRPGDPLVPRALIERLRIDAGLLLDGPARRTNNGIELTSIESIEGGTIDDYNGKRQPFSELISVDPTEKFQLETESVRLTTRVLELLSPLGKGQRCLIVAPPKAGKTTLLKDIAHGIETNHPETIVIVLLVDERPEEVTDMRRSVRGEVIASSSDESAENHITIAEMVLERARRLVELGRDVVILCDSITRMSRAYNNEQKSSGRILSGGIDARTMEKPRRFFGSARNAEHWGSLTIVATALIDTGSRMDEVIFQEFKGTGNTEIMLDRGLFERRIFPAINIPQTGTRKEEKLLSAEVLPKVHTLRRALAGTDPLNAMRMLLDKLQKFPSNDAFLRSF